MNTNILKTLAVVFATVLFVSCDNDYNSIGGSVIGDRNYDFNDGEDFSVYAYNSKLGPVQTNKLPVHQLGYLENDKFETTTANFVTQLDLAKEAPVFTTNIAIDSVVLTVPYFSRKRTLEVTGRSTYRLDSIYSNATTIDPIGLKIFRNGYTLSDFDASNPSSSAQYYSNQDGLFDAAKVSPADPVYDNPAFVPSDKEFVKYKVENLVMMPKTAENIESRAAPRMRLMLDPVKFGSTILNAGASNLATNDAFKNFYKGLYFQTQTVSGSRGSMMMLDFSKGNVTIYYKQDKISGQPSVKAMKELTLNFSANNVNLFNHANDVYSTPASAPIAGTNGHENLYLKGGEGSTTFVELFPTFSELENLWNLSKTKGLLINDAYLTFTVNETATGVGSGYKFHPNRVYLYDADTNKRLYDYNFDNSINTAFPKLAKYIFGGILSDKKTYKIRVTEHIANLLKSKDLAELKEKNVRLGLVISEDINEVRYAMLKTSQTVSNTQGISKIITQYPMAAVINPLGTILFGNVPSTDVANYDKRVRFKISYTKPN
ncbi:DUF4270 domain-containing protein [Flavobacterium amnicola]|uniref:DUF4270 domain-containing protein n=1 Tax=Flavobacterium amnicola TaxID=2506422 RepID=A0A4Q1K761_9FLAO|nr:DUF4270 domain-containing protein [Flavobacterium amnicola]RXR21094.1 DUF4270 domain-containing protein [Flavobacterium amnicola]